MTTSGPGGDTPQPIYLERDGEGTEEKESNHDVTCKMGKQSRVLRVQDGASLNINNHDFSRHIEVNYCTDRKG